MYKVAVVDDEPAVVEQITNMLYEYASGKSLHIKVEGYGSGDQFLSAYENDFDIIFFDVDMPGMSGFDAAKRVRVQNPTVVILFCTNLAQYAIKGYEVSALGYLVKPIHKYSFAVNMDKACRSIAAKQDSKILVKTLHGQAILITSKIVYVEVQGHNIYYYMMNENGNIDAVRTRGAMSEVSNKLSEQSFAKCSVSYIVNLKYIKSVENNTVKMPGANLPVSRSHKKIFSERFMQYLIENEVVRL